MNTRPECHIITCEYPPQLGGISDYTWLVGRGLAAEGDAVHVWCPGSPGDEASDPYAPPGVTVHRTDLRRLSHDLDRFERPRRLLVQWVPHGYGYRSMNLPFCIWLWKRARISNDKIEIMVHEPFLAFGEGSWKQDAAAAVHRFMVMILLNAASRVWVAIPAWEKCLRPYLLGRRIPVTWLPIPSNIPSVSTAAASNRTTLGHFGTFGESTSRMLEPLIAPLLRGYTDRTLILMGKDSDKFRLKVIERNPDLTEQLQATGEVSAANLSDWLRKCHVMIQPYPDGISSRRGTAMAALSHGVPIVTTTGKLTEAIWEQSGAVELAPVGDVKQFLNAMNDTLADAEKRSRMSLRSRELYSGHFDVSHTVRALRSAREEDKKRSIAFLINGDSQSAAAFRARAFAGYLDSEYRITMDYRGPNKVLGVIRFVRFLLKMKPTVTYVCDLAYSGVIAALLYRFLFRNRLVIDTGDSIYAFAQSIGRRRLGLFLTWLLEWCSLRFADQIVVRGTAHKHQLFAKGIRAEVIQDGVESELFRPMDVTDLRHAYGLDETITIGLVGSITWSPNLRMCYGTELLEAICLLRDLPVKGVVIGDGSGLAMLKSQARERGIEDRILFLGRIPYDRLPKYLNLIDICLSTQTNDAVGQVRTTGKLPLYLASGRFVLASRVGEAALVLPDSMLVDYENTKDPEYPQRLARKIRAVCDHPQVLRAPEISRSLAVQHFDYALLSRRLSEVLR